MSTHSVALDHYRHRQRLVRAVAAVAGQLWRQVDPSDLGGSWTWLLPRLMTALSGAQMAAAAAADDYLTSVLTHQGIDGAAKGRLVPRALSGVAADGRSLDSLLRQPVIAAKTTIQTGQGITRALSTGLANLDLIIRTEVADAGRVADQIALTARPEADGYVRMIVGKTCPRCAILAGRRYRWNQGFNRHPRCDCIHIPAREDSADDLRTDPKAYFRSLSEQDQDRLFTKAGALAIRDGADMNRVVNARRGMYVAGGRQFTNETAGRRQRLMPEQIFRESNGDRAEALRLLRLHVYIL